MDRIEIFGENRFDRWTETRTACRGIVLRGGEILLCFETHTGQYMIPGGGLEPGEDEAECCAREIAEETGAVVRPGACRLEIDEYYEEWKFVSRYFFCEATGSAETRLTDREREVGMEPRWVPVERAVEIFSRHRDYAETDEMRRGMYLREYTALNRLLGTGAVRVAPMTIGDYDRVHALWMNCKNMGFNNLDDSREGIGRFLARNPNTCFVAFAGGELAGTILAGHDGRRGYIYHAAVAEAFRRRGVGAVLVNRCLEALRAEGIHKVALVAFRRNEAGNAFWEKMGFAVREDLYYRNRALAEMERIDT